VNDVLISTAEASSRRLEDLREQLGMDSSPEDRIVVLGHLLTWYAKWAGDPETDSGLFWNVTEKRLGVWAQWTRSNPLMFGRALVKAGYVQPVNDVFPEQLLRKRDGYVVPGALDRSWSIHRLRANKLDLVLFLLDPVRRARQAAFLGLKPTDAPTGWLDFSRLSGDVPGPGEGAYPSSGGPPEDLQSNSVGASESPPRGSPHVDVNVEKKKRMFPRKYVGNKTTTGAPKTRDMLEYIQENKYENPLECLRTIDGTDGAVPIWIKGVEHCLSDVQTMLANMTETDEAWAKIGNPAAVAMSRIKAVLRARGIRTGNGQQA